MPKRPRLSTITMTLITLFISQRNYSYWLFEGVRVQPTLSFEFGYGLELVGVSLRVSLAPKERDRKCLFDFACHVLRRQREGEGHRVIVPCAISKMAQPTKSALGADKFKLRIGLLVKHRLPSLAWRAHTHAQLTEAIRQPRVDRAHGALRLSPMPWLFPPRLPCPLVASSSARPKHDSVLRVAGTPRSCA